MAGNNQKAGIAIMEQILTDNNISYSLTGKNYPLNITSMVVNNVHFTVTPWEVSDFAVFNEFLTHILPLNLPQDLLKKELFAFSNISVNIDEVINSLEQVKDMIKADLKYKNISLLCSKQFINRKMRYNKQFKSLKYIIIQEYKKLDIDMLKLDINAELDISYIKGLVKGLLRFYKLIYINAVQKADACCHIENRINELENIIHRCGFYSKNYVKDSYQFSKNKLITLLANGMKNIRIAQDKFTNTFDARIKHVYTNTESAFIYNGYYITPCILFVIIKEAWKSIDKNKQNEFLKRFYEGKKTDIKKIADDCLFNMFNNNDIERLTMLDELRLINNKGAGV